MMQVKPLKIYVMLCVLPVIRKCLSQIQTSSRNHFLKENNNSVSPGFRWILNIQEHSKENIAKAHKGIAVSTKMQDIILKGRFLAIYYLLYVPI